MEFATGRRVSVIYPVYNENPDRLQRSLSSLQSQTFVNYECIIIDDSTEEATSAVCKHFADNDSRFIQFRPEKRLGLTKSLNFGMEKSRGEYIARFDSDDICLPERLATQVAYLDENPNIGLVGSNVVYIDANDAVIGYSSYPESHHRIHVGMQYKNEVAHPTVMFRKRDVTMLGGYDESFSCSEDVELWLRMLDAGILFNNLHEALILYRTPGNGRPKKNWLANLRARRKNFSSKMLHHRVVGILCIAIYSMLPYSLCLAIYRIVRRAK